MPDGILIRDFEVLALCGALPEEQARRQPFAIDLDIDVDVAKAGRSDDLDDTVNYAAVCDRIATLVESDRFVLLERFATAVADLILDDDRIDAVTVEIRKLRPPVPHRLSSSGVRLTRHRA